MNARTSPLVETWERAPWALPALCLLGLFVRLLFVGNSGFATDVGTFEAWTISLLDHGLTHFYAQTSFVDYPPGYFYILDIVGHLWLPFRAHDPGNAVLQFFVKLPAIVADIGIGVLLHALARRFTQSPALALGVAALYLFNPATIYISASWGQVDCIAGGLALLAAWLLLRSDDLDPNAFAWPIVVAWLAMSYSLLIKPQAAVIIPIFVVFALVDPVRRRARVIATVVGIVAAFALAAGLSEPFHPGNPFDVLHWLLQRYQIGSSQYPEGSVNAFNLWAISLWSSHVMWNEDSTRIFGIAQSIWGLLLLAAALVLIVWRYVSERTPAVFLQSCALALLAFFVLSTRMHERYSFNAVLFAIACVPIARRYLWASIVLSIVLLLNLNYSLEYLHAVSGQIPGANPYNLWGPFTRLLSIVMVGTFFVLGYIFLGASEEEAAILAPGPTRDARKPRRANNALATWLGSAREYFDPSEGLARLRVPLDYVVMGTLGVGSFILSYINYWLPTTKIFDEVYFARAAEEYLRNQRIYENTHPPLTKLLVTLSVMMFGGLAHGDNSVGWRFLDVVFGALVVMLLYAFAKRVTGSTVFAAICALLLTFDGMHYVQSRIATPEGFVVFFATAATYAFYRFWIASQVETRAEVRAPDWAYYVGGGGALLAGAFVVAVWKAIWHPLDTASMIVVALYVATGVYMLVRYAVLPRRFGTGNRERTYAESSYAMEQPNGATRIYAADGGTVDVPATGKAKINGGDVSGNRSGALVYDADDVKISYRPDGCVTYETPDASAVYKENTVISGEQRERGGSATTWLIAFTVALGCLISSKWYGVMGFPVSFFVLALVWAQRYFFARRPTQWGNARGFRLDGAMATIVFIAATIYGAVWIPDLVRHSPDPAEIHNFNDVTYRQYSMFMYHDTLVATHPYSSKFWEWPLDYVPVAYFYQDNRPDKTNNNGCCVQEITSMPNPLNMWLGLLTVPIVGVLAWLRRNKAYALIVITYLFQWLPWARSPRITFAYHFYVDIPLICLCNAIVLQQLWLWGKRQGGGAKTTAAIGVGAIVAVIAGAFVFFYPILAAHPITWNQWHERMWFDKWIVGPG